jgi:hypothetical protein
MIELTPGSVVANSLDSRLVAIKFMFRDANMIYRDSFCFSVEFCKRAAACIELEPVGVNKEESANIVELEGRHCVANCFVGSQICTF